jgi:STE24 endopeptidase
LLILFTRVSTGMRNVAERLTRWRGLQTFIYGVLFIIVFTVLTFPLTIYERFYREHAYGLSNMTLEGWLAEFAIGTAISILIGALVLTALYALIRGTRNWWLWATGVVAAFTFFGVLIAPIFIEPLFNTYKEMDEGPVKESILSMARANGVPTNHVYQVDASRQTDRISANVAGFLGTVRIALNDNLLKRCTVGEVKAVMAHELGHYVLNHIVRLVIYTSLLTGISFAFASWFFGVLNGMFGGLWGVRNIGDVAGLPILAIGLALFNFAATPVSNSIIRQAESEADIFGLNSAREPDAWATVVLKLAKYRKLDPTPLEEIIFYDHPSGRSRIRMGMQWKSEHLNEVPAAAPPAPAADAQTPAATPDTPPPAPTEEPVPQGPSPD